MTESDLTRRAFSARLAALLSAYSVARLPFARTANAAPGIQGDGIIRDAEAIHQEITIAAAPKRVYEALMDAKQFSKMTGNAPAEIDRKSGGAFSLFGARIKGWNVFLLDGQLVVQAWRSEGWQPAVYSIVRFDLRAEGTGTKIVFDHTGFPKGEAEHLAAGWKSNYWEPLAKFLA